MPRLSPTNFAGSRRSSATTQPVIIFLSVDLAIVYGIIDLMLVITHGIRTNIRSEFDSTFPSMSLASHPWWTSYYHESVGIGGLHYIAIMIGLTIGAQGGDRIVE